MNSASPLPRPPSRAGCITLIFLGILILTAGTFILQWLLNSRGEGITANQARMSTITTAIQGYKIRNRTFPARLEDLVTPPPGAIQKPFLPPEAILDVWNEPFLYKLNPRKDGYPFILYSKGPDKKDGTDDDDHRP